MRHVHLIVHGRVQGVWFRASTKETADDLGLTGWVRNVPDNSVEIDAQGNAEDLERFIRWCRQGPPGARVTDLDIRELETSSAAQDFRVVR